MKFTERLNAHDPIRLLDEETQDRIKTLAQGARTALLIAPKPWENGDVYKADLATAAQEFAGKDLTAEVLPEKIIDVMMRNLRKEAGLETTLESVHPGHKELQGPHTGRLHSTRTGVDGHIAV